MRYALTIKKRSASNQAAVTVKRPGIFHNTHSGHVDGLHVIGGYLHRNNRQLLVVLHLVGRGKAAKFGCRHQPSEMEDRKKYQVSTQAENAPVNLSVTCYVHCTAISYAVQRYRSNVKIRAVHRRRPNVGVAPAPFS